jgi:hypothetical protein
MAVDPAVTTPESAALIGVSTLRRYLSPVPETVIASALVNQVTITAPTAQLTVDNTSVDWADVTEGMTVYIGTTSGARDIGTFRVRKAGSATILYIGETSSQDVGRIPIAIRLSGIVNNAYITVLQQWNIDSVLPVINAATGAIYEDYDLTVSTNNTTPPPLVNIKINGRRNHLATLIADGATFALSAIAAPASWPTSAGESFTYAWTTPASGWANVAGETTTTLTADVDPGNYVLYLTVTGSASGATKRVVVVHVHDNDVNPPLLISEMPRSDNRDRTGRRMSFDLYSNRLESIPNGAACFYFEMPTWANQWVDSEGVLAEALDDSEDEIDVDDGSLFAEDDIILIGSEQMLVTAIATNTLTVTRAYNGTTAAAHDDASVIYVYAPATDVPTATRQMFGWVQRQDKSTESGLRQATIDLVSPSFLLAGLNSTSQVVTAVASPANWQQVKPTISTASFMAWYMLRWRCANVLLLFNFTPFSTAAAGQRLPSWTVDKGTVLQQIQSLATERGNFGCDSEGEFYFLRHPSLINYADRASIVVRDSVDASIYSSASNPRELSNRVQQVRGEGFSWDGAAALPTPYYSDAPKVPAQGTSQIKLPAQVVTGQSELNQLTGDRYMHANNPYPNITYTVKRNRDVIEPAQMCFVDITIPVNLSSDGIAYEGNIIPLTVQKVHNADGTSDITVTGEGETHNVPGDYVPVPVANDSVYVPDFVPDPIDPLPLPNLGDFGSVIVPNSVPSPQGAPVSPGKGAIWVNGNGAAIKRTLDISVEPPTVDDVTPSDAFFTNFVMVVHDKSDNFSRAAYALGNDGTDSKVAYTTDIYADTVQWDVGGTLDGIYTQIESAGMSSLAGSVSVYSPIRDEISTTVTPSATVDLPGNNTGIAITTGDLISLKATLEWCYGLATPEECVNADGDPTNDGGNQPPPHTGAMIPDVYLGRLVARVGTTGPWIDIGVSGSFIASATDDLYLSINDLTGFFGDNFGSISVDVIVNGGTGKAFVSTSDDYGATWAEQDIGATSGGVDAAFCLSRFGSVSLAAIDATLEKASTFGGTFSSVTGGGTTATYPIAARIPWFKIGNKSATNNGTSPDFYMASAVAISTESLWKVIGGTKTAITPSVTGTKALAPTSNSIGTYSANRVCFIGDVGSTRYIFKSTNSGTSWSQVVVPGATSVRAQRFSPSGLIWIAATSADVRYSSNGGVSWSSRTVYGGAIYCELFG